MLTKALVALSLAMAPALAAGPPPGPLPSEALVLRADGCLMGFDARALLASTLYGQMSRGEFTGLEAIAPKEKLDSMGKEMQESIAKGLEEAEDKTGVRLDRDVDRVVIAVGGLTEKEPLVTVLAIGRFDRTKVTAAWRATYEAEGGKAAPGTWRTFRCFSSTRRVRPTWRWRCRTTARWSSAARPRWSRRSWTGRRE